MASITFLFGAGADSVFGLADGVDFATAVIGENDTPYESEIVNFYSERAKKVNWYPSFKKTRWKRNDLLKASIRKELIENSKLDMQKQYNKEVNEKYNRLKNEKSGSRIQIDKYTSYMGLLDEHFHSLINPKVLGSIKFWRVVLCYARAYCSLASKMLPERDTQKSLLMNNPKQVLEFMRIYASKMNESTPNYYNAVYEAMQEYKDVNFHVITSNYTTICQTITGIDDTDIAYVHGKIGWFESARDLCVYDFHDPKIKELPKDDIIFPYLFVQSGIKPIVDPKQIREYSKMVNFLDESPSTLIIVGYRINADDNHINSIIRSYLVNNKRVIYFSYKDKYDSDAEKETEWEVLKRLRLEKSDSFEIRNVDRDDSLYEFQRTIKEALEAENNE